MTYRIVPRYEDNLWYPILVKMGGGHRIIEMQGVEVNAWNDMVREQWQKDTEERPNRWYI